MCMHVYFDLSVVTIYLCAGIALSTKNTLVLTNTKLAPHASLPMKLVARNSVTSPVQGPGAAVSKHGESLLGDRQYTLPTQFLANEQRTSHFICIIIVSRHNEDLSDTSTFIARRSTMSR